MVKKQQVVIILLIVAMAVAFVGGIGPAQAAQTAPATPSQPAYQVGAWVNVGGTDTDEQPSFVQLQSGHLGAAFISARWGSLRQVAYTESADNGLTWSAAVQISQMGGQAALNSSPSLTANSSGLHLVWSASDNGGGSSRLWYTSRSLSGGSWSSPTYPLGSSLFNTVVADLHTLPDGSLRAVLFGDTRYLAQVVTVTTNGANWSAPLNLTTISHSGQGYAVAYTGMDSYLAFADIVGDNTKIRTVGFVSGQAVPADIASGRLVGAQTPGFMIAGSRLLAAYCGWENVGGSAHREVYTSSRSLANGSWLTPTRLTDLPAGQSCEDNAMSTDVGGNSLLLYNVSTLAGLPNSYSTLYLAVADAPASSLVSFGGQVQFKSQQLVTSNSGLGLLVSYRDLGTAPNVRRVLYAPLASPGTPTNTATSTNTPSPTETCTPPSPTATNTTTTTTTATATNTATATATASRTISASPTASSTMTLTSTMTATTTTSPTPTASPTLTITTVTATTTATTSRTTTATNTATLTPPATASRTTLAESREVICPPATATGTASSTATNTPLATATPSGTSTNTPAPPTATLPAGCQVSFSDVPSSNVFYYDVTFLACHWIVSGYANPGGGYRFEPNSPVRRAEFAKIASLAFGIAPYQPSDPTFSDVPPSNPLYLYVEAAAHAGIVGGFRDGNFRPNDSLTRAQLALIVNRARHYPAVTPTNPTFSDVPNTNFAYAAIETLAGRGIIGGAACSSGLCFRPNDPATRGATARIVRLGLER